MSVFKTQPNTGSDPFNFDPIAPPEYSPQAKRWTTDEIRALSRIFHDYYGPFSLATILRLLDRRDFVETSAWIIRHRQSAIARAKMTQKRAPRHLDIPVAHIHGSTATVIGGVEHFEVAVYDTSVKDDDPTLILEISETDGYKEEALE